MLPDISGFLPQGILQQFALVLEYVYFPRHHFHDIVHYGPQTEVLHDLAR